MHRESARIKTKLKLNLFRINQPAAAVAVIDLAATTISALRIQNNHFFLFLFLFLFFPFDYTNKQNKKKIRKIFQSTRVPRRSDSIRLVYFSLPPGFFVVVLYNNSPILLTEINFCLEKWIGRDCVHVSIFFPTIFIYLFFYNPVGRIEICVCVCVCV
jgi:glucose-6-phosphate 1-dehydrogenase